MKNKYNVIGLMSGTSLDGVDIVYCEFSLDKNWSFRLIQSETILYDDHWKKVLGSIHLASAEIISKTDCAYGNFLGKLILAFCEKYNLSPDFISSHGHTVFHQPDNGFTKQIGSGAHLAATSGYPVICDFRSVDVALGGQGAPLVPVGDKYLFPDADYCLNLGGIANVSFEKNNNRIAFDICACNLVLNYYASKSGHAYDENGKIASGGKINVDLIDKLNNIPYYSKSFPKSLGREDVEKNIISLINGQALGIPDILATYCEHIAMQISKITGTEKSGKRMLLSGGGTLNTFLVKRIIENCGADIIIPEKKIIEFKEAIIFGFLGILRMRGEVNCLKTVTGAQTDSCGGAIYWPIKKIS